MLEDFRLKLIFDDDEYYDIVYGSFKRQSVNIQYFRSFVPPNKVEYFIGPLTKIGVLNWLKKYEDFKFNFEVLDKVENRVLNDYEKEELLKETRES